MRLELEDSAKGRLLMSALGHFTSWSTATYSALSLRLNTFRSVFRMEPFPGGLTWVGKRAIEGAGSGEVARPSVIGCWLSTWAWRRSEKDVVRFNR